VFLLVVGIRHIPKQNKNAKEALATWTDLIVGAAVVVLAAHGLVRAVAG
jgi:hypothetical protein